jgi:hypothetical protein
MNWKKLSTYANRSVANTTNLSFVFHPRLTAVHTWSALAFLPFGNLILP